MAEKYAFARVLNDTDVLLLTCLLWKVVTFPSKRTQYTVNIAITTIYVGKTNMSTPNHHSNFL